jgi:hypothetical protein
MKVTGCQPNDRRCISTKVRKLSLPLPRSGPALDRSVSPSYRCRDRVSEIRQPESEAYSSLPVKILEGLEGEIHIPYTPSHTDN